MAVVRRRWNAEKERKRGEETVDASRGRCGNILLISPSHARTRPVILSSIYLYTRRNNRSFTPWSSKSADSSYECSERWLERCGMLPAPHSLRKCSSCQIFAWRRGSFILRRAPWFRRKNSCSTTGTYWSRLPCIQFRVSSSPGAKGREIEIHLTSEGTRVSSQHLVLRRRHDKNVSSYRAKKGDIRGTLGLCFPHRKALRSAVRHFFNSRKVTNRSDWKLSAKFLEACARYRILYDGNFRNVPHFLVKLYSDVYAERSRILLRNAASILLVQFSCTWSERLVNY